jgi:hypothetical protein
MYCWMKTRIGWRDGVQCKEQKERLRERNENYVIDRVTGVTRQCAAYRQPRTW